VTTAAPVVVAELRVLGEGSGQQSVSERAVSDDPGAVGLTEHEEIVAPLLLQHGKGRLQRVDVANPFATLYQVAVEVRDAQVLDEAVLDQPRHCLPRLFDLHIIRTPVKLVEVDRISFQAPQAFFGSSSYPGFVEAAPRGLRRDLGEHAHVVVTLCRSSN
jgi:hypothetical protein